MDEMTSAQVVGALRGTPEGRPSRLRVSRPCYDKPHRCPGWAGGGCRAAKEDRCTEKGGYVSTRPAWVYRDDREIFPEGGYENDHPGSLPWRFGRCDECGMRTWPYVVRWVDWRYVLGWKLIPAVRDWRHYRIAQGSDLRIGRRDHDWWEVVIGKHCWTNMPDHYGEDSYR